MFSIVNMLYNDFLFNLSYRIKKIILSFYNNL